MRDSACQEWDRPKTGNLDHPRKRPLQAVCFGEKADTITLCNHVFHRNCLAQVGGSGVFAMDVLFFLGGKNDEKKLGRDEKTNVDQESTKKACEKEEKHLA